MSDTAPPRSDSHATIPLPRSAVCQPAANSWPPQFLQAIALLLQGSDYAQEQARDLWDFALEIDDLRKLGLTSNDLRWMVCKGWLEHARELGEESADGRVFTASGELSFGRHTCFVLTDEGVKFARQISRGDLTFGPPEHVFGLSGASDNGRSPADVWIRPRWDPECHRLYVGNELVKEFKHPSPNQGTILMAFEEENWPGRIDDPLPPSPEIDPKMRLRYTIKSLNKKQKKRLIRFMGDGSGEGVMWELLDENR